VQAAVAAVGKFEQAPRRDLHDRGGWAGEDHARPPERLPSSKRIGEAPRLSQSIMTLAALEDDQNNVYDAPAIPIGKRPYSVILVAVPPTRSDWYLSFATVSAVSPVSPRRACTPT
jgi:hypothetical protein